MYAFWTRAIISNFSFSFLKHYIFIKFSVHSHTQIQARYETFHTHSFPLFFFSFLFFYFFPLILDRFVIYLFQRPSLYLSIFITVHSSLLPPSSLSSSSSHNFFFGLAGEFKAAARWTRDFTTALLLISCSMTIFLFHSIRLSLSLFPPLSVSPFALASPGTARNRNPNIFLISSLSAFLTDIISASCLQTNVCPLIFLIFFFMFFLPLM